MRLFSCRIFSCGCVGSQGELCSVVMQGCVQEGASASQRQRALVTDGARVCPPSTPRQLA
jgi:hypothetical protein